MTQASALRHPAAMREIETLVAAIVAPARARAPRPGPARAPAAPAPEAFVAKAPQTSPALGSKGYVAGVFALAAAVLGLGFSVLPRSPLRVPSASAPAVVVPPHIVTVVPQAATPIATQVPPEVKIRPAHRYGRSRDVVRPPTSTVARPVSDTALREELPVRPPRLEGAALERALAEDRAFTRHQNAEELARLRPESAPQQ